MGDRRVAPSLAFSSSAALFGALCALPGAVVVLAQASSGLALAVGALPAAVVGILPRRRARLALPVLGLAMGLPITIGGLVAGLPPLAVATLLVLGPAAAALGARMRLGLIAMQLSLPMVGIGLSYSDPSEALALGALIVAGSIWGAAVSMLWPQSPPRARGGAPDPIPAGYGLALGLAGASTAAIGFALGLEHVGWACAAALLVIRPSAEMLRLRGIGRLLSVIAGALVAIALVELDVGAPGLALAALLAVSAASATRASRWYVTPAFTTLLVFLLLLEPDPGAAGSRLAERSAETLLGVAAAYVFGLGVPALAARREGFRGSAANSQAARDGDRGRTQ